MDTTLSPAAAGPEPEPSSYPYPYPGLESQPEPEFEPKPVRRRSGRTSPAERPLNRRTWIAAFLGFFLLGAAWSFAAPYDGPPDELQHVLRAYGLMSGHLADKTFPAPKGLQPNNVSCARWHHDQSYACAAMPGTTPGDGQKRIVGTTAYAYPPLYYYAVGLPIRLMPDMRGIIAARLLTDAIMAGVLAACVAVVGRLRSARWLLPALIVAATPVVVNLAGAVNPAGPEIVFGIGLWVAVIALVELREISRGVAALAAVCGVGLAVTRSFGLGWLAAVIAVGCLGLTLEHAKTLWRAREFRIAGAVIGVGILVALWWHFTHASPIITAGTQDVKLTNNQIVVMELWDRSTYYTAGLVSLTSYGDVPVPDMVNTVWYLAAGFLIFGALAVGSVRDRLRVLAIIVAAYIALYYADYSALKNGFWESQGRYALPLLVGAPLLGACVLHRKSAMAAEWGRVGRLFAVVLLPIQLIALAATMVRWQQGQLSHPPYAFNPFHGTWLPVWGPVPPVVFCCLGIALIGFAAFTDRVRAVDPAASRSS